MLSARAGPIEEFPQAPVEMFPCSQCGRTFVQESLAKHESACSRLSQSSRNIFESGFQRANGSDINEQDVLKVKEEIEKAIYPRPQSSWRRTHEQLLDNIAKANATKTKSVPIQNGGT